MNDVANDGAQVIHCIASLRIAVSCSHQSSTVMIVILSRAGAGVRPYLLLRVSSYVPSFLPVFPSDSLRRHWQQPQNGPH